MAQAGTRGRLLVARAGGNRSILGLNRRRTSDSAVRLSDDSDFEICEINKASSCSPSTWLDESGAMQTCGNTHTREGGGETRAARESSVRALGEVNARA